jgi:hypothetical protein
MGRFKVQLRGENFLLDLDGEHAKFFFTATRIVKADSQRAAERIALIQLHQEINRSAHIVKNIPNAPRVFAEQTELLKIYQSLGKRKYRGINFIKDENETR